jgi:hypothetical protein
MEKCFALTVFSDADDEKLSEERGIMHKHSLVYMDINLLDIMQQEWFSVDIDFCLTCRI